MINNVTTPAPRLAAPSSDAASAPEARGEVDTVAAANPEAALADLSQVLAQSAQRETLATNLSSVGHRIGMNIIGNLKA